MHSSVKKGHDMKTLVCSALVVTLPLVSLSQAEFPDSTSGIFGEFSPGVVISQGQDPDIQIFPRPYHQVDASIAVRPTNADWLLVAGKNFGQGIFWCYSTDGGITWSGGDHIPNTPTFAQRSAVAFDADGNGYVCYRTNYNPSVWAIKTTDGGQSWQSPVSFPGPGYDGQTPRIVADVSSSPYRNRIYLGYSHFLEWPPAAPIMVSRSLNQGSTFLPPINISGNVTGYISQGVRLDVNSNGQVFAVWAIYDDFSIIEDGLGFARSTNGGDSWLAPSRIYNIQGIRGQWTHKNSQGYESTLDSIWIPTGSAE
jgi:hypothetical protein